MSEEEAADESPDNNDSFREKITQFATTVFDPFKRENGVLPKSVREMIQTMETNGEDAITTMQLIRSPVQEYVKVLLQGISKGNYKKAVQESPYDNMFHLSIRLNSKYRLEKNEVISLTLAAENIADGAEFIRVVLPRNATLTIQTLLDKTRDHMGAQDFSDYNARTNNCQDFVMAVLRANDLNTELLENFTHQDAETVFEGMPEVVTAIAETMTDAAAVADRLVEHSRDECRSFLAAIAQRASRPTRNSQQQSVFVQQAQQLQDEYGDDIPEEKLKETMAQLHLSAPHGPDIVLQSSLSSSDKADEVMGMLESK